MSLVSFLDNKFINEDYSVLFFDIETTGLSPLKDRVISIAWSFGKGFDCVIDDNEKLMLEMFWALIDSVEKVVLCGFNVKEFDYWFLRVRSLVNGVKVPASVCLLDLRDYYKFPGFMKKGSFDELVCAVSPSFVRKTDAMGKDMLKAWVDKDFDTIRKHNLDDVRGCVVLFKRMKECGFF